VNLDACSLSSDEACALLDRPIIIGPVCRFPHRKRVFKHRDPSVECSTRQQLQLSKAEEEAYVVDFDDQGHCKTATNLIIFPFRRHSRGRKGRELSLGVRN